MLSRSPALNMLLRRIERQDSQISHLCREKGQRSEQIVRLTLSSRKLKRQHTSRALLPRRHCNETVMTTHKQPSFERLNTCCCKKVANDKSSRSKHAKFDTENLRENLDRNKCDKVEIRGLRWGTACPELGKFNVVIMSDLICNHNQHLALLKTSKELLADNASVYVSFSHHRPALKEKDLDT